MTSSDIVSDDVLIILPPRTLTTSTHIKRIIIIN